MKSKKLLVTILLTTILIAQFIFTQLNVFAETSNQYFELAMQPKDTQVQLEQLHKGDEFDINVNMVNARDIGKGIIAIGGKLTYTESVLDLVSIKGAEGWGTLAIKNGRFIIDANDYIKSGSILTMKFRVRESAEPTATQPVEATITLNGVSASGGNGPITVEDTNLKVKVIKEAEEPEEPKEITSTEYKIDKDKKYISKVYPSTTVTEFKENIQTKNVEENEIKFTHNGTALTNNDYVRTGTVLTVGEGEKQLVYTIVVRGDIDGLLRENGAIVSVVSENDLAIIKLDYIKEQTITNEVAKIAADYDCDGNITVNDIAKIKLTILGKINNGNEDHE